MYADWVSTADSCGVGAASFLAGTPTVSSELGPVLTYELERAVMFPRETHEQPRQRLEPY